MRRWASSIRCSSFIGISRRSLRLYYVGSAHQQAFALLRKRAKTRLTEVAAVSRPRARF
jgi:hypothetical protein